MYPETPRRERESEMGGGGGKGGREGGAEVGEARTETAITCSWCNKHAVLFRPTGSTHQICTHKSTHVRAHTEGRVGGWAGRRARAREREREREAIQLPARARLTPHTYRPLGREGDWHAPRSSATAMPVSPLAAWATPHLSPQTHTRGGERDRDTQRGWGGKRARERESTSGEMLV